MCKYNKISTTHTVNSKLKNQTRSFNELVFSEKYVIKKSTYVEKFFDEITWMINTPRKVDKYFPKIYDYSLNIDNLFIKMQRIHHGSLHDYVIKNKRIQWKIVVGLYKKLFDDFKTIRQPDFKKEIWQKRLLEMYILKTVKRLSSIQEQPIFSDFFASDFIKINGQRYCSIKKIMKVLNSVYSEQNDEQHILPLRELIKPIKENICLLHGDCVFSNVFIDCNKNSIICVDPRGSFDDEKTFGDRLYDYAKVYQCVYGMYDFIIEDKFQWKNKGNSYEYKIFSNEVANQSIKHFNSLFPKKYLSKIKLIESLLFLSMIPLHSDSQDRQMVMLLQGITKFCKVLKC